MSEKIAGIPSSPFARGEACEDISAAEVFKALPELYGPYAATAAAWCAIEARRDEDVNRYRFWFGLFCDLRKTSPVFPFPLPSSLKTGLAVSEDDIPSEASARDNLDRLLESMNVGSVIIREIQSIIRN